MLSAPQTEPLPQHTAPDGVLHIEAESQHVVSMQVCPCAQHVPPHTSGDVLGQQTPLGVTSNDVLGQQTPLDEAVGLRHCSVEPQHDALMPSSFPQSCATGQHMLASADIKHCSPPDR
jgi:hypothetical protein